MQLVREVHSSISNSKLSKLVSLVSMYMDSIHTSYNGILARMSKEKPFFVFLTSLLTYHLDIRLPTPQLDQFRIITAWDRFETLCNWVEAMLISVDVCTSLTIKSPTSPGLQPPRGPRGDGGSSRQHTRNRRTHRRVTHNEKRYHSGIYAHWRNRHLDGYTCYQHVTLAVWHIVCIK